MKIDVEDTTLVVINDIRKQRPEWVDETNDDIIFHVCTEWLAKQGEQSLNEWMQEFF